MPKLDMRLVSCVLLDPLTVMLTVRELSTEQRWLRMVETERVKSYVMAVRVGRWLDGNRFVLRPDPRHFRLWELFAAWRVEQMFDRAVGIAPSVPLLES